MAFKKIIFIILFGLIVVFISLFTFAVLSNIKKFEEIKNNARTNIIKQPNNLFLYSYKTKKFDSIQIKNKKVFIHLWATWCRPCIEEFDNLNSVLKHNAEYEVFFITNEDSTIVSDFLSNKKLDNISFYGINKEDSIFDYKILPTTYYSNSKGFLNIKTGKNDWIKLFKK